MRAGERVRKRGSGALGTVEEVYSEKDYETMGTLYWFRIKWDDGVKPKERPLYCSHKELELADVPAR